MTADAADSSRVDWFRHGVESRVRVRHGREPWEPDAAELGGGAPPPPPWSDWDFGLMTSENAKGITGGRGPRDRDKRRGGRGGQLLIGVARAGGRVSCSARERSFHARPIVSTIAIGRAAWAGPLIGRPAPCTLSSVPRRSAATSIENLSPAPTEIKGGSWLRFPNVFKTHADDGEDNA